MSTTVSAPDTSSSPRQTARALIVTADDFGLHARVNIAVEHAHRDGVLTAASLMVGASAVQDAVERARRLPALRVGLHLVLADGVSILPHAKIPALVDKNNRFGDNMVRDGFRFFFLPHVRAQLAHEIRAQFEAFAATGLALDHVNTHKHFHLHPTVLSLILQTGRDYGLRAVRLPFEAGAPAWLRPWIALVRSRLARANIAHNDYVIGIEHTGGMDEAVFLDALAHLPDGVGEIYCHPAVATLAGNGTDRKSGTDNAGKNNKQRNTNNTHNDGPLTPAMQAYRHADELAALLSPRVAAAMEATGVMRGGFVDVFPDAFADIPAHTSADARTS